MAIGEGLDVDDDLFPHLDPALDPSQLTLVRGEDADDITLRVAATEDELKAMPEYQG